MFWPYRICTVMHLWARVKYVRTFTEQSVHTSDLNVKKTSYFGCLTACLLTFERFKMNNCKNTVRLLVLWIRILAYYFSKIHLHNSSNIKKVIKKSQTSRNQGFSCTIFARWGKDPDTYKLWQIRIRAAKNMRILIHNTGEYNSEHKERVPSFLYLANIEMLDIENTVVAKPPLTALMTELTRSRLFLINLRRTDSLGGTDSDVEFAEWFGGMMLLLLTFTIIFQHSFIHSVILLHSPKPALLYPHRFCSARRTRTSMGCRLPNHRI